MMPMPASVPLTQLPPEEDGAPCGNIHQAFLAILQIKVFKNWEMAKHTYIIHKRKWKYLKEKEKLTLTHLYVFTGAQCVNLLARTEKETISEFNKYLLISFSLVNFILIILDYKVILSSFHRNVEKYLTCHFQWRNS